MAKKVNKIKPKFSKDDPRKPLTPMQKAFCEYYIIDYKKEKASIRAGYSKKTAKQMASENLTKPNVKRYIDSLEKIEESKRYREKEDLLKFLWGVLNADLTKIKLNKPEAICDICNTEYLKDEDNEFCPECGAAIPIKFFDGDLGFDGRYLDSIKRGKNGIEFKLVSKGSAAKDLGEHFGMFKRKLDVTSNGETIGKSDLDPSMLSDDELEAYIHLTKKMKKE